MGVTPWSPLKGGVLTGKYSRADKDSANAGRGAWVENHLTERNFKIVDELKRIAENLDATPAQVALAWVQAKPAVTSTIIGARTMDQLQANLKALDIELTDDHAAALDDASAIEPTFPQSFLPNVTDNVQGGATINGVKSEPWNLAPKSDDDRW